MLYPSLATLAFAILLFGYSRRKGDPRVHASLMTTSMAIDLGLVLTLELTKNAVATAVGGHLTGLQLLHVATSSAAVVFYIPVFVLGSIRLFRPSAANAHLRAWHRRLGYGAIFFRAVGYVSMFSMIGRG